MSEEYFETLVFNSDNGRFLAVNPHGEVSSEPSQEAMLFIDRQDPFKIVPTSVIRGWLVNILGDEQMVPRMRLQQMQTGPVEQFRAEIGFGNVEDGPMETTVAAWTEFKSGIPRVHELIVGGPMMNIEFPMSRFKGHDNLPTGTPDTKIKLSIFPDSLKFKQCSNVTPWRLIEEQFQDTLSTPGTVITWSEGNPIYTRFKVQGDNKSNDPGSTLTLILEAMPLKKGQTLEGQKAHHKAILTSGCSRSLLLWSKPIFWHAPSSRTGLATTPGIYNKGGGGTISDGIVRWHLYTILTLTRRGSHSDGEDWDDYLSEPYGVADRSNLTYNFVVSVAEKEAPTAEPPVFALPKGKETMYI